MRLEKAKYKIKHTHDYPIISHTYSEPYDIYFSISDYYSNLSENEKHYIAAEAQGWCELAAVGDKYEADDFIIEVEEDWY